MRTLHTIDYSEAQRIFDLIVGEALRTQKTAAVAVADAHGELICAARMDRGPVARDLRGATNIQALA